MRLETSAAFMPARKWREMRPCPVGFEKTFIEIGRDACEDHFAAGRATVTRWLEQCGKRRLIAERAKLVRPPQWRSRIKAAFLKSLSEGYTIKQAAAAAGVSAQSVHKWRNLDPRFADGWQHALASRPHHKLMRTAIKETLEHGYPLRSRGKEAYVSPAIARRAAHHLRIVRNGGWRISPMADGVHWRLGLRIVAAIELVELAVARGFDGEPLGGTPPSGQRPGLSPT